MNLNQITIPVRSIEKSIAFYEQLGLRLIVQSPQYARFECPDGDATFSLHEAETFPNENGTWIYFELDNLDNYVQQLTGKGFQFEELPNDKSWRWRESRLRDPDNHIIILYFAGDNRKNPPWRIS
jgi:catechol 2,3-dioxygenase-like lactoylglutathione lyase family enzyme